MTDITVEVARSIRNEHRRGASLATLSRRHKIKPTVLRGVLSGRIAPEPMPSMMSPAELAEFEAWWAKGHKPRFPAPEPTAEQFAAFSERVNKYMERTGVIDDVRADVRRRVLNRLLRAGADVGSK